MKSLIRKIFPKPLFEFLLNKYHFLLAFLGALIYRFPSRKLKVIGVTGTNGKTTTVEMISKILEQAGYKVAISSSIKFQVGKKKWLNESRMTMPGRFALQKLLRTAALNNCQYVVIEVSSEGILQHRHRFINFETAIFTNLSPEHIERHHCFENYRQAKGKLFQATKNIHIVNIDDENAEYFLQFPAKKKYLYKVKGQKAIIKIIDKNSKILEELEDLNINLKLLGNFNIYNALAAICVGMSQKISLEICKKTMEKIEGIPGRMEEVISQPFKVFIDYAITPVALEKVYQTLSTNYLPAQAGKQVAKLICVLGACGGGRDKWKRQIFGKIAAKYCDEIIITNEDPYDENPIQILSMIKSGIQNLKATEILDRREAIKKALNLANKNDTIIITGKGCEPWMCVEKGKKIPWNDREIVREEFKKLKK